MTETPEPPPTTVIRGRLRRGSITLDAYTDLTGVDLTGYAFPGNGFVDLTFPAALTAEQVAAVKGRLESVSDEDQKLRAEVAKFMGTNDPNRLQIVAMLKLLIPIVLGDTEQSPT